jgi:hypothetical protein
MVEIEVVKLLLDNLTDCGLPVVQIANRSLCAGTQQTVDDQPLPSARVNTTVLKLSVLDHLVLKDHQIKGGAGSSQSCYLPALVEEAHRPMHVI